jgi:hypothetical protein
MPDADDIDVEYLRSLLKGGGATGEPEPRASEAKKPAARKPAPAKGKAKKGSGPRPKARGR